MVLKGGSCVRVYDGASKMLEKIGWEGPSCTYEVLGGLDIFSSTHVSLLGKAQVGGVAVLGDVRLGW